jgi:type IV pilus assembly protein PilM
MGFRLQFGKNKVINLSIKDHVIRFVELKQTNPPVVQRFGERYLPSGLIRDGKIQDAETLESILEECFTDWKISKKNVRFIVPDSFVTIRKIPIPKDIQEDEIKGYLFMEIGTSIHLPFENPIFDYVLLEEKDDVRELLLFSGPEEAISEYSTLLENVKLKPLSADISPLSLFRLYHQQNPNENDSVMLIQADLQAVTISIFEKHKPLVMRHIKMDVDLNKWEFSDHDSDKPQFVGNRMDIINPLEDIYSEIDRVMNFYNYSLNHGALLVSKVIIDGDHPWLEEIKQQLNERFTIPVLTITNSQIQVVDEEHIPSTFHLNIGLGMKEVG